MFLYVKYDGFFFIFCNYMIIGVVVFGEIEGFWIIFSVLCFLWLVSGLIGYNYGES